jgi:ribokinase
VSSILVIGSYNVGLTVVAPTIPRAGETVLGSEFHMDPGGKGSNQAIGIRRLGGDVRFVCKVGDDVFGRSARELFVAEGLETTVLTDPDAATGAGIIAVDEGGQNAIAVAPGANARLSPIDVRGIMSDWFDWLLVQLETPVETVWAAAAAARDAGARVVLNPAPAGPIPDDLLDLVHVLTPNETELEVLAGRPVSSVEEAREAAESLRRPEQHLVVTRGAAGALWLSEEGAVEIPGAGVDEVVDTTGAGDAFNAGLVFALAEGRAMRDAIELANRAGAFCVTRRGVVDGLPRLEDLE